VILDIFERLNIFERLYYMRALAGVAAGIVAGIVIPPEFDQYTSIVTAILVGMVFYFASLAIGRRIAKNVPKDKRKKVATEGIMPFIFLLLTFMIIVYTALHQSSIVS
jgi:protein-S-isoprenylcysteine O-methyltransferase Ste14